MKKSAPTPKKKRKKKRKKKPPFYIEIDQDSRIISHWKFFWGKMPLFPPVAQPLFCAEMN